MVKAGQFRDDLYYRLSGTAIMIPPLRQRRDDIGALTAHFSAHYNWLFGKDIRFISSRAMAVLTAYDWPGNVRELSNTVRARCCTPIATVWMPPHCQSASSTP
jgi:transcriptional regulator with PAS, ATPase and Fis domain